MQTQIHQQGLLKIKEYKDKYTSYIDSIKQTSNRKSKAWTHQCSFNVISYSPLFVLSKLDILYLLNLLYMKYIKISIMLMTIMKIVKTVTNICDCSKDRSSSAFVPISIIKIYVM